MSNKYIRQAVAIIVLLVFFIVIISAVAEMPRFGDPENPPNLHVIDRYFEKGEEEAGCKNIVTNIILNYRGYDTMGEVTVIFTALCAILAVLKREDLLASFSFLDVSPNQSSIVVKSIVTLLFPLILLFGFYIITHGEDTPGGGFQGGTVIAASFILYALIFGFKKALTKIPVHLRMFFEIAAPSTFFLVGIIGFFAGLNFLSFMLPVFPEALKHEIGRVLLSLVEVGIGIGGGAIFTSIFFSMQREES